MKKYNHIGIENNFREYKENNTKQIKKEIGAFLNNALVNGKTRSYIDVGITDQRKLRPLSPKAAQDTINTIKGYLNKSFKPSAIRYVHIHFSNGLIHIVVNSNYKKVFWTHTNRHWIIMIRQGTSSERADPEIAKELLLDGQSYIFDIEKSKYQDLHFNYLHKRCSKLHLSFDPSQINDFYTINNNYTNKALLFSDENLYFSKGLISYDGLKNISHFKFKHSIIKQIDDILNLVKEYNKKNSHYVFVNGTRVNRYNYPLSAVREVMVNALVHRNYYDKSFSKIAIYNNKIRITSPGSLPNNISKKSALNGESSPRNPNVLDLMAPLQYTEQLGSGLIRTRECYKKIW